jgi:starch synthase (maltosyl-transferring)
VLVVVNLNFYGEEHGFVDLNLGELGLSGDRPYQLHDLLNDATFHWEGRRNFVKLDPAASPAHVFRIAQA